jgi:hypothetical protein
MSFLPVVQRELLTAARKPGTFWARTASAGILLGFFLALLKAHSASPMFIGPRVMQWLSIVVFFECMIAGLRYTCDCLSEEKREGTLGLLFLTNLTGLDVVLGKMIARSLGAFYNLVAVMPVLALPILMGGVTGEEVTALCVVLLVSIIFSLSAGTLISSRGLRERSVLVQTLVFLIGVTLGPRLVAEMGVGKFWSGLDAVRFLSPMNSFIEAGRGWFGPVRVGCIVLLMVSAGFITCAAWRIRDCAVEAEISTAKAESSFGAIRRGRLARKSLLSENPMLWPALRSRTSSLRVALFCGAALFFGAFDRLALELKWRWMAPFVIFGSYGFHALFKFLITAEACRQLSEDRRSGALELLLTTPLPPAKFVRAPLQVTAKTWRPAAVSLALMNCLWMTEHDFFGEVGVLLACSLVLLALDGYALAWRGVANALKGERYTRTVFRTFFAVMLPPLVVITLILAAATGSAMRKETVNAIFVFWTLASIVYDLSIILSVRTRLIHFRSLAAGDSTNPSGKDLVSPSPVLWRLAEARNSAHSSQSI